MPLLGGFAQLILPEEIKQVEPIKALNEVNESTNTESGTTVPSIVHVENESTTDSFSGLIIDARGIAAQPAMVPIVVDESGKEVYSPAFVSREFAVQNGVCRYTRSIADLSLFPKVAPNPLLVKGLRTVKNRSCDIVISNTDAFKIRDASTNLTFLKQCRVIIVLD